MEWLNVVVTPVMAFLGVVVSSVFVLKTKKLELADKDKKDLYDIVKQVVARLDEMQKEQSRLSFVVSELQTDVKDLYDMSRRMTELEKIVAVIQDRLK